MKLKGIISAVVIIASVSVWSSCSTSTPVMAASGGMFTVTKTGTTGFTPLGVLRKEAYEEADRYASSRGMSAEVVSVNEVTAGFAKWPQVDLRFRLVKPGMVGTAKAPSLAVSGQASYDAEGRPISGETAVVLNKELDVYAELKKIGDLKERGILTEEEFQREKQRLLNSNR